MNKERGEKKVLIITYYWPPSGGGGVQRWLKFIKYLREFDWEPIVYTPENPSFDLKDESLLEDVPPNIEVIKQPIWEPFESYKKWFGSKSKKLKQGVVNESGSGSILNNFVIWIRGNFFIPDPRRFWVKPSVKKLKSILEERGINIVVTTGPPHSMHLIGLGLKKALGEKIKWMVDFRDPWSKWDMLPELKAEKFTLHRHRVLEEKVIRLADDIIAVSPSLAKDFQERYTKNVHVVTNGFDEDDIPEQTSLDSNRFVISHIGLMNELRNPEKLWRALSVLANENKEFDEHLEINLAGAVNENILRMLENDPFLSSKVNYKPYIGHSEVFTEYRRSSILLLLVNTTENAKWILPGKMFEYLAAKKPILALGPKGIDMEGVLATAGYHSFYEYDDYEGIISFVESEFRKFQNGQFNLSVNSQAIALFNRRNLTKKIAERLDLLLT